MLALNHLVDSADDDETTNLNASNSLVTQVHSTLPDAPGPRSAVSPNRQMGIHFMLEHDAGEPSIPITHFMSHVRETADIQLSDPINENVSISTNQTATTTATPTTATTATTSHLAPPSNLPNQPPFLHPYSPLQGSSTFPILVQQPFVHSLKLQAYPVYSHSQFAEHQHLQQRHLQYPQQQRQPLIYQQHSNHHQPAYNHEETEHQPQLQFINTHSASDSNNTNNNNNNKSNHHPILHQSTSSASQSPQLSQIPPNSPSPQPVPHKRFTCTMEGCGKVFFRKHHLVSHMVSHTEEKPFRCTIPGCDGTFRRNQDLRRHLRKVKHD
ncbi:hypothetical protein CcCBS67573_g03503 [Chytriomyces confervae]|uniref:C2H2-type domain-containing protein n=1 Tax=Chytriomyces confervae TaxID=246404 RepID=A0A507FIV4_9FUNG|nr:hypothetical protein CcCBS67573_g03503 [Chytriomyces confervae]